MKLKPGLILESTDSLNDTFFARVKIYVTEYNSAGAVGFVINKIFGRPLNELEEFKHSPPFPLYDGGPVDREHLFFLHRRPDLIDEGTPVASGIYRSGNFRQAVTAINNKSLAASDIKIFVGYCGWDAGELEAELAEGSWVISAEEDNVVFRPADR